MVWGHKLIEVDVCKTVGLGYVLCVGFLGKVDGYQAVLVGRPLELCPKKSVNGTHEFDLELGSTQTFKATLDLWVPKEVD